MSEEFESRLRRSLASAADTEVSSVSSVLASAERSAQRTRRRKRMAVGSASLAITGVAVIALVAWPAGNDHGELSSPEMTAADTIAPDEPPSGSGPEAGADAEPDAGPDAGPGADQTVEPPSDASIAERPDDGADADSGTDADLDGDASTSSWSAIAPDPAGVRQSPQVVWTGAEAIAVYGTDETGEPRTDLSSYIPSTGTWREISRPPIDSPMAGQHVDPLVMWTGTEMLMIGGRASGDASRTVEFGAFAFEPYQGTWRTIAAPDGAVDRATPWAWTGDELLVWSDPGPTAFDPTTSTWRDLADPPVPDRSEAASVWSGSEWIVWGGSRFGDTLADGAAYDPATDTWRVIAEAPLGARRAPAVWTGSEMIVASGSSGDESMPMALADGAAYDPATDTWRPIAAGFAHPGFEPVWTGTHLVMFAKGDAAVYDPTADTWVDQCCSDRGGGPGGTPVWTGTSIVAIGSSTPDAGGSVFVVRDDRSDGSTIPIEIPVDRPDLTSISGITIHVPDDAFERPFTSRTADPGATADLTPEFPSVNSWVAASCGCQLGVAVVEDFGDDAPLYGYLADTERITSANGEWMLMVGEHPQEPTVAFLRIDGILIQASIVEGTRADLEALVDGVEIDRR